MTTDLTRTITDILLTPYQHSDPPPDGGRRDFYPPALAVECHRCGGSGSVAVYSGLCGGIGAGLSDDREEYYRDDPCEGCAGTGTRLWCDEDRGGCGEYHDDGPWAVAQCDPPGRACCDTVDEPHRGDCPVEGGE